MIRIGIVGSDNSHAVAFSQLANVEKAYGDEARVVAICGAEPARTQEVAEKGQIERIVAGPEAMLGAVDAAMVVYRHGDLHMAGALPFLEAGLPVFVDKPFAVNLADARRMEEVALRTGAPLTSFSTIRICPETVALIEAAKAAGPLRVGTFTGPCDFNSEYAGPFFYGTHSIELALALFGEDVQSVSTASHGGIVASALRFGSGALVTLNLTTNASYVFHGLVVGKDGWTAAATGTKDTYRTGMSIFLDMVRTGRRPFSDEQLLNPIRIMHAIAKSVAAGGAEVTVASVD